MLQFERVNRVREVRGGIVIEGWEINRRGRSMKNIKADVYPQRRLCRPIPRPAAAAPKAARVEALCHGEMIAKATLRWPSRRSS